MAVLLVNPRYRARLGPTSVERLLTLPGPVVSGHTDRHVRRVDIGGVPAFLKREHRVPWRDRLSSAAAGFGFVSKSLREAKTLAALRRAGVGVPEWIAAGEEGGRAFLLIEELTGFVELRVALAEIEGRKRRALARRLGAALAALHGSGYDHPDLYAKHVFVDLKNLALRFIDFQRSAWRLVVGRRRRARDLAALDATLADGMASDRERYACLRAYVAAASVEPERGAAVGLARSVRQQRQQHLQKGHIRKERAAPVVPPGRAVLWLDGEALCVTSDFWDALEGKIPPWLPLPASADGGELRREVLLPDGRRGLLERRSSSRPWAWLAAVASGRRLVSPEVRQAGRLFATATGPRVLAFGERRSRPWRVESFLLTAASDEEGPT